MDMHRLAAAVVIAAALAAPATAAAATTYLNTSGANGAYVIKSGDTLQHFEIYCAGQSNDTHDRAFAFSLANVVNLKSKGKFSYSSKAFRYGPERQPRGTQKVKVKGRVTSTAVRADWKLPGCGSGSVTARRQ
jgi:hypothetical protein